MEVQQAVRMAAALRAVQQAAAEVALGAARQEVVRGWEEAVMGMAEEVMGVVGEVMAVAVVVMEQVEKERMAAAVQVAVGVAPEAVEQG